MALKLVVVNMHIILITLLVSLFGIVVGSLLNTIIFRTQSGEFFSKKAAACRTCLEPIATLDLIPIWSYFSLRGKCRKCQSVIEWQYPAIELTMGILFGLLFLKAFFGINQLGFIDQSEWFAVFIRDAVMASFLVIIFVYDFRFSYILDRFSIPAMLVALLCNMALGADMVNILLGGLLIGSFFAFQFLLSRGKWIGAGDIRMGLLMGFFLGLELGVLALFLSYVLGAFIGIILILTKKRTLDSHVPFGTFLALATLITLFFGVPIVNWYISLL